MNEKLNASGDVSGPRLTSLDALRGFDMLWIVGADAIGGALAGLKSGPVGQFLAGQMDHAEWVGFHFYDLIFPLFVFMVGVAIPLSLDRLVVRADRTVALRRVLLRGVLMYGLGLLYYGGMAEGFAHLRLMGVLQRLAICYVGASVLYLYFKPRTLAVICGGLLVGYWALLTFVPVPGFGPGDFARGHNLTNWIDSHYLPLRLWYGDTDPEGLLSNFPAIASCLLGVFAGRWVSDPCIASNKKWSWLVLSGIVLMAAGYGWGVQFPVIKRLWTSSFVLVAGGWSVLLLAGFYYLIEVRGWRGWAQPFVWIGSNALTIYLVSRLVSFENLSARFVGGEITAGLNGLWPGLGGLVLALFGISLCIVFCRFLYVRKIFLRL